MHLFKINTPKFPYIEITNITNCTFLNNTNSWGAFSDEGALAISTGVLTVENISSANTIYFNGVDELGEYVTAHFKGSIQ